MTITYILTKDTEVDILRSMDEEDGVQTSLQYSFYFITDSMISFIPYNFNYTRVFLDTKFG